ncbi:MAG: TetR/AcrR family transcriptional regulator [Pseudomonadota bacterium]|jgi:TetR/AcrR family transcriptional regulator, cholesterol catabolism regulator|nr:TetR/AcrR family transcriptional regulator [Alphaproteobacteria bacterium]
MLKSDRTRQRILDTAAREFRQRGYAGTKVNDIALAADMRAASIYYYFESKDQLFEEVLKIGLTLIFEAVRRAVEAVPDKEGYYTKLLAAVEAHLSTLHEYGDYSSANIRNFGQTPNDIQERQLGLRNAYGEYWRELLIAAQEAGVLRKDINLSLLRMYLFGAMNWSLEWVKPGKLNAAGLARELCHTLFEK